mgnify:CR=1 FL=1
MKRRESLFESLFEGSAWSLLPAILFLAVAEILIITILFVGLVKGLLEMLGI